MNENEFAQVITTYENRNITTRLQQLHPTISGPFVFWLSWDNKNLKVTVTNSPFTKSYFISEKEICRQYYPNETFSKPLRYYRIKVSETQKKRNSQVLELWGTADGLALEIYKLHKGFTITGTQIFPIIRKFLALIQPKHFFLQDLADVWVPKPNSNKKDKSKFLPLPLPLRLSKTLTSVYEQPMTWYEENLDVRAANVAGLESGWNLNVSLTQCSQTFYDAAKQLRSLPFTLLLQHLEQEAVWLQSVATKYFPGRTNEELTAKDIFTVIFDKENMKKPEGYADFEKLYQLLQWGTYYNDLKREDDSEEKINITNKTDSGGVDGCVKSIIRTRFFAGTFKKTGQAETKKDDMQVPNGSWKRM